MRAGQHPGKGKEAKVSRGGPKREGGGREKPMEMSETKSKAKRKKKREQEGGGGGEKKK